MRRWILFAAVVTAACASAQEGNARAAAIASAAPLAKADMAFLEAHAQRIRDGALRAAVLSILRNPAPTFMSRYPNADASRRVHADLAAAGLIDPARFKPETLFPPLPKEALSFSGAPGGTEGGHHAYPGGLAAHTAFNLQAALDLEANFQKRYGIVEMDHDVVIAAPILHDAMKAWCLQWNADGTELQQATIAQTASHHIFIIAEILFRKLSPELAVAVAGAHEAPHLGEEKVAGYLRAGAVLAGVDPVQARLVAPNGRGGWKLDRVASFEAAINHLSDHDYVIEEPAGAAVAKVLDAAIDREAKGALSPGERRWVSYRVLSRTPSAAIFARMRQGGEEVVVPLVRDALAPSKGASAAPAP